MARSKTSNQWLKEHFADPYVKEAHKLGYRSRAAFKLLEIQEKDKLLKPGMVVVDLGAAPGSWSQIAVDIVGDKGKVFALDILPMDSIVGVDVFEGDFREEAVLKQLEQALEGRKVDLVISDIAPNMSGYDSVDQPKAMYLVELALDFAKQNLRPGGNFCCKVFQGVDFEIYFKDMKTTFKKVITRKPKSSRGRSREVYLIGIGI